MQPDAESPKPTPNELARRVSDPAFLAALAHDLRGPLGAIGTWVHVLGSGRADAATQHLALAAMQRDVAAQSRLADQLSDLSSILGGTLSLSLEDVDLASLMGGLGADLRGQVSSPRVLADPGRLRQLLAILLPAPGPAVPESPRAVLIAESTGPATLLLRGLARKGGPGLVGTTLARALAELQGGRLTISPTPEGDTAFAVQLPAPEPAGMDR